MTALVIFALFWLLMLHVTLHFDSQNIRRRLDRLERREAKRIAGREESTVPPKEWQAPW
jgi:hypothetical protein